jgi:hypothetical protein
MSYQDEGRVRDLCADHKVVKADQDLFVQEFKSGIFSIDDMGSNEFWERERERNPCRFVGGNVTADEQLYHRAFVEANLTAQGAVLKQCGGDLAAANAIAERFGSKLGSTKPGIAPKSEVDKVAHAGNPWAPLPSNLDKSGRYNSEAFKAQAGICRRMGDVKAASIAAAVGARLGDVRPRIRVVA